MCGARAVLYVVLVQIIQDLFGVVGVAHSDGVAQLGFDILAVFKIIHGVVLKEITVPYDRAASFTVHTNHHVRLTVGTRDVDALCHGAAYKAGDIPMGRKRLRRRFDAFPQVRLLRDKQTDQIIRWHFRYPDVFPPEFGGQYAFNLQAAFRREGIRLPEMDDEHNIVRSVQGETGQMLFPQQIRFQQKFSPQKPLEKDCTQQFLLLVGMGGQQRFLFLGG